jgi:two-component system sensor histidine kinase VicK
VFSNIFSNALRYSPENGQITITLSADSEGVSVSFTDQGPGIPKQDLERIFDRFYKVDRSRNRQEGVGSGLGLAISREIILAHGGRIRAESDGSSGTTISVLLPRPAR